MLRTILTTIVLILSFSNIFSQKAGEIFSKQQADSLFGEVVESVEIEYELAEHFLNCTNDFIMFKLIDKKLVILDRNRDIIYSEIPNLEIDDRMVFHMYRATVYKKLLSQYDNKTKESVFFEQRKNVFSVTYKDETMEKAFGCPPRCGSLLRLWSMK